MNIDEIIKDMEAFDREGSEFMTPEQWLPSPRLNGHYEVSNFGRVSYHTVYNLIRGWTWKSLPR